MDEHLDFAAFLNDRIKERGLTLAKLSELSGVAPEHLTHMTRGEFSLLPSAPYVRGYLDKLAHILEFDANFWWEELKRAERVASSGKTDELAKNRFAQKSLAPYLWSGGILALALILYVAIRLPSALAHPRLVIETPAETITRTAGGQILVSGTVEGVDEVRINSEPIQAHNGRWESIVSLQQGLNTIEISAKKLLGGETKLLRQVVYEPPIQVGTSTPQPSKPSNASSSAPTP